MLAHPATEASESLSYIAPVLRVSDISRSLAFYRDRFGFTIEFAYESFYAGVCRGGCHIHL
jgi:catechol 2,3-dioxygenase-like lactoylglutathione lyase family enzyme